MNRPFRALRHRDFRLFILGQGVGILGYWIQQIALAWMMYRISGSAFMVGFTLFASQVPVLLLSPVAGALSDRVDRYRAFVVIQSLQAVQGVAMAVLALAGWLEPWHMVLLAAFLGTTIAFELPIRHAFTPQLLDDRADLPNAVAVTSLIGSSGRLVGPSVAGLTIGALGEAACFVINALTYLVVLGTLAGIRHRSAPPAGTRPPMLRELREGALYAWNFLPIRVLLIALAVVSFMATPYNALMPAFVREAYDGGPETLGFLIAGGGCGALLATIYLSAREGARGLLRVIVAGIAFAGIALVAFSQVRWMPLSLMLMAVSGFGILAANVSVSMIIQTIVDDDKRGRVMSLYTVAFLGISPLGSFAAGAAGDAIGAANTFWIGGASCVLAALWLGAQRARIAAQMRPIYERLGIGTG
jgi:MFS family permease